jgi:hypothetical protein
VPLVADPWFWAFSRPSDGICAPASSGHGAWAEPSPGSFVRSSCRGPRALLPLLFVSQPASRRAAPYQGEAGAVLVDQPDGGVDGEQLDRIEDELGGVSHVGQEMTRPMTAAPVKESPGGPGARCARARRR